MTIRALAGAGGPILGLLFVAMTFGILIGPSFFLPGNLELVARQTTIVCAAALGMTVVIIGGGIDLSAGSVLALTTVAVALLLGAGWTPAAAALAATALAALCGLINGALVTGLRLVPFIVTLGTMIVIRGAAKGLADERRIEAPATWLNDLLRARGPDEGVLPGGVWLVIALAFLVGGLLRFTRFGRHVFALGSNERAARLCGIAIARTKIAMYAVGAGFAGVAGVLQFSRLSVGDPTVAEGLELDVIAAVIIGGGSLSGGRGTVFGTILGATTMAVIQLGCAQKGYPNWIQQIVTGAIIVLAVALDRWRQRPAS